MRLASLCSGYGGLELGLAYAGFDLELVWHAENDPEPAAVMAAHHDTPNLGDITTITTAPPVDVITAGWPCQPVSGTGLQRGIHDERWLIRDVVRIAELVGAHTLLLENVPGLLTTQDGAPFQQVLEALAGARFDVRWTHLRASAVGSPYPRQRWFAVAQHPQAPPITHRTGRRWEPAGHGHQAALEVEARHDAHRCRLADDGAVPDAPAGDETFGVYTAAVQHWERVLGRPSPYPLVGARLNQRWVEWLMGLPEGWVTDVIPGHRSALRILGNGVVPQAAAVAFTHLLTEVEP